MAVHAFNARSFLIRWVIALILVLGTFNPSELSFYHWLINAEAGSWPLKILVGIGLLIAYVVFFRATWRSIGPIGLALAVGFFGVLIWLMIDNNLLDPEKPKVMAYVGLIVVATLLAIGMSWSHIRRRISGQLDTDVVDD